MRKLVIGISLAIIAFAYGASPAAAQTFYFGFSYGPRYHDSYHYRPHWRHYRQPRRYIRRHYGPPVSYYRGNRRNCEWQWGRRYCCPDGFTVQDGVCKPYRGY